MNTPKRQAAKQGLPLQSPAWRDEKASKSAVRGRPTLGKVASISNTFSTDSDSTSLGYVKKGSSPDSDESRSPRIPFTPATTKPGKPRSAERSLQKNRPLWKAAFSTSELTVCLDSDDTTQEDVKRFLKSTALLVISVWNVPERASGQPYEGQMSIVMDPRNLNNQCFLTASHNVLSALNEKGELEEVVCLTHILPGVERISHLRFPRMGDVNRMPPVPLRDGVSWTRGFEICRGPAADPRSLLHSPMILNFRDNMEATKVVDNGFDYAYGTKVAIAAYTGNAQKLADMPKNLELWLKVTKAKLQAMAPSVFGQPPDDPLELNITTGTITWSQQGSDHIEYNVNTVGGHSGALVVVHDPTSGYHLQAIAIHAGYSEDLKANIGFKLQGMFN